MQQKKITPWSRRRHQQSSLVSRNSSSTYMQGVFTLKMDHKSLMLLALKHEIPMLAASRLQRWALQLSAYQYDIKYHSSEKNLNADALSRLPQKTCEEADELSNGGRSCELCTGGTSTHQYSQDQESDSKRSSFIPSAILHFQWIVNWGKDGSKNPTLLLDDRRTYHWKWVLLRWH